MIKSTHYSHGNKLQEFDFPIRLHEKPSYGRSLKFLGAMIVFIALVTAPPAIVYVLYMFDQIQLPTLAQLGQRLAAGSSLALLAGAALTVFLIWKFFDRLSRRRVVTINNDVIKVRERRLFKTTEWQEPLRAFTGLERDRTATVGGWQHRLFLSHPEPKRRVSLWVGDEIPSTIVAGYQTLLFGGRV